MCFLLVFNVLKLWISTLLGEQVFVEFVNKLYEELCAKYTRESARKNVHVFFPFFFIVVQN